MATYQDYRNLQLNAEREFRTTDLLLNDWMSLPAILRKPMPCTIFKKNITRLLIDKYF